MQSVLCVKIFDSCCVRSDNRIGVAMNGTIYHERQVKELCALHALNNLFQESNAFTKAELDAICYSLSPNVWINPHKSFLGLGNYDINVIMSALQRKGCEAIWFDKRKDPRCLNLMNIFGFILNVPSDYKLGFVLLPLRRRHWIAIRQIQGDYYNLDSKIESPQLIGKAVDLIAYLQEQLECKEKQLFVVVSSEVDENQSWLLSSSHTTSEIESNNKNAAIHEEESVASLMHNTVSLPNHVAGGSSGTFSLSAANDSSQCPNKHNEESAVVDRNDTDILTQCSSSNIKELHSGER